MDGLYVLSDDAILRKIGERLRASRLKQNITQKSLAEASEVTLITVIRLEKGEIGSFSSLLRVMRVLGLLDCLQSLVEDEQMSPQEYYDFVNHSQKNVRKRAVGKLNTKKEEDLGW